jgi:hypothetical protein
MSTTEIALEHLRDAITQVARYVIRSQNVGRRFVIVARQFRPVLEHEFDHRNTVSMLKPTQQIKDPIEVTARTVSRELSTQIIEDAFVLDKAEFVINCPITAGGLTVATSNTGFASGGIVFHFTLNRDTSTIAQGVPRFYPHAALLDGHDTLRRFSLYLAEILVQELVVFD